MIFIIANVLNSARSDSTSLCELVYNLGSIAHKFSVAKMASEVQKPLDKMDFLLVCG